MQTRDDNLQKMANDIAAFFTPQSQNEIPVAAKAIAGHIRLFWSPKMRERFARAFDAGGPSNLAPAVVAALRDYRPMFVTARNEPGALENKPIFPEGGGDAG